MTPQLHSLMKNESEGYSQGEEGGGGHSLKFSRTLDEMFSTPALHYPLSAESFSCKKKDMKMFRIDAIFFGFARCHHLELLALYLGTGLYLSPVGKWGWVCRWFLLWQLSIYMFPPYFFFCVFFDPAIRWWKISWLPPPSSLKATTKNQCYYLLPNPHVDRLKVYNIIRICSLL